MAMVREVLPRDTSAENELLRISVNALDPAHAGSDPIESLVVPAFKEMATKFGSYLASGGVEPTWGKVVEGTSKETLLAHALRGACSRGRQRRRRCSCRRQRSRRPTQRLTGSAWRRQLR